MNADLIRKIKQLEREVEKNVSVEVPRVKRGTWAPTFTGFSADPTGGIFRYVLIDKTCTCLVTLPNVGTSGGANGTLFRITSPFTAATVSGMEWFALGGFVTDNGSSSTTPGMVIIASAGTYFNLYRDVAGTTWTNANGKGMKHFCITYEVA